MTNCPPRLRGDLSKWLCEINTGVYVGNVSGRVRDAIWKRVCQNLQNGQATMVFTAAGEQRMDFRTHNTTWEAVDFDGIKLMRRPLPQTESENDTALKPGFSKVAKQQYAQKNSFRREKQGRGQQSREQDYTVIDLETTGLDAGEDAIIEYGALRIRNGRPEATFTTLVRMERSLPVYITELTGIKAEDLEFGMNPRDALRCFMEFIGKDALLGHNISFDMEFLRQTCKQMDMAIPTNRCIDLAKLARRKLHRVSNYKLATLAEHFRLTTRVEHRALPDCNVIYQVYCKVNELGVE
jgi:CRISPR-associated protein Cas2